LATQRNKILAAVKIIKQISQRGIKIQLCVDGKKTPPVSDPRVFSAEFAEIAWTP
jgi:hypothetical protein